MRPPLRYARRARQIERVTVVVVSAALLGGCAGVLDPQGPVGRSERVILLDSLAIMLAIIIPVMVATVGFAWWFRASNTRARRLPNWSYSGRLELIVWSVPLMVVLFLGGVGWVSSHALDPAAPLKSDAKPLEVQVVSLDWKWLFIYPAQGVASVNQLVIPVGVPVHFSLTSATVMNSFFVPQLGSQIYTMAGMITQLNLQADRAGRFAGLSAQFSGDGFSGMGFVVAAVPASVFNAWIKAARAGGPILNAPAYARLARTSRNNPVVTFSRVEPGLFEGVVDLDHPAAARSGPTAPPPRTQD